jgi:hypothetical protein
MLNLCTVLLIGCPFFWFWCFKFQTIGEVLVTNRSAIKGLGISHSFTGGICCHYCHSWVLSSVSDIHSKWKQCTWSMTIDDANFMARCWTSKLSRRRNTKSFRNGLRGRPVCEYAAFNRELRTVSRFTSHWGYSLTDRATPSMSCQKTKQDKCVRPSKRNGRDHFWNVACQDGYSVSCHDMYFDFKHFMSYFQCGTI